MDKSLAKISHKYEFLKLELEENQEQLDGYLDKWNSIVGKYMMDKQKVMRRTCSHHRGCFEHRRSVQCRVAVKIGGGWQHHARG